MSIKISVGFITCRENSQKYWLIDSLANQMCEGDEIEVIVIDLNYLNGVVLRGFHKGIKVTATSPKPCIWSGDQKITKDSWWSKPNEINTFLCLAQSEWVLLVDDRSIFAPGFLDAIRNGIKSGAAIFGRYEKRVCITVENGQMTDGGTLTGVDSRYEFLQKRGIDGPYPCPGEWAYGCCVLAPVEWLLQVNGSPEMCCGMGFEDAILGLVMQNNSFPMMYDPNALLIEDRTPSELGTPMRRTAKERWPNDTEDKAHTLLKMVKTMKSFDQPFGSLRELRDKIQVGGSFPSVDRSKVYLDWFDQSPIKDL